MNEPVTYLGAKLRELAAEHGSGVTQLGTLFVRVTCHGNDWALELNDDKSIGTVTVQGTAAVVGAAALAAVRAQGRRLRDQRVVIHGAGTAGVGVADLLVDVMASEGLSRDEARAQFWCTASRGLVTNSIARLPMTVTVLPANSGVRSMWASSPRRNRAPPTPPDNAVTRMGEVCQPTGWARTGRPRGTPQRPPGRPRRLGSGENPSNIRFGLTKRV